MRRRFEPLDASLKVGEPLLETAHATIELCVGEPDHRLGFGESAVHFRLQPIDLAFHLLVELSDGFSHELNLMAHPLRDDIEMASHFRGNLVGVLAHFRSNLVGALARLGGELGGVLARFGGELGGVLARLGGHFVEMASCFLVCEPIALVNHFEETREFFDCHRSVLLCAVHAIP